MNRFTTRAALVLLAVTGTALTAFAQSTNSGRGALLYENHCQSCHTTEVHFRAQRKSRTIADVRAWVVRWQENLELGWTVEEVDDVTGHLNSRFYQFAE